ncbi:non-ribosomal peptide synthetase, partial [Nitrosomonas halophila]
DMNPLPVGVTGELYLGGRGLARGYLNRPGLTAERFIADPFDSQGGRLYRTGDLARWREDGQIEYLGRVDHQVKIRGFRIELGEIETQLLQQLAVREAVVVAKEGASGTRLVAYVALHADHAVTTHALRDALAQTLPDYMLPSAIVVLDSLPLNANGKVDRSRLPEPEFVSAGDYAAPEGEVEPVLANIWAEVLGMGRVGRNDNFFELGGDSILSLQIVTKARRAGWKITPRQLFERQTIAALAGVAKPVEEEGETVFAKQMAIDVAAPIPLLPIQLEFFEQPIPARHHWNQTVLLTSRQRLRAEWLDRALRAIVQHHRALRFCYEEQADGHWIQRATASAVQELLWERRAADHEQFLALCNAAQRSLDLHDGPLLRALLIDMADGTQRFLLAVHHLVIDGVSWRILLEDLKAAYDQSTRNEAIVLPEVTTDYAIWTQRLQHFPVTHAEEFDYWQSLAGITASLPCDFPEGSKKIAHQCSLTVKLDRLTTQALLKEAPVAYRTQVNDLLLTALGGALCRWSGHERILIDLEGHGREDLYADVDLSRTIGWFTSLFPVALDPMGSLDARIKRIKEGLRQIPHKGLGYGLFKYYGTEAQRRILANLPEAQVVFNYLGQFDGSFEHDTPWQLADEPIGDLLDQGARQQHDLSINGHILGGELCLEVSYSKARYARTTIEAFIRIFFVELESVITHCQQGIRAVTPSDFPLIRIAQDELDRLPIPLVQLDDLYPLSPMQTGMLFHSVFDTDASAYLNQLRADIDHLSLERFKAAWQAAIDRHEILRTGFVHEGTTPLQWVARTADLPFVVIDWRDRILASSASLEHALDDLAWSEHAQGIDLKNPPLLRITVVCLPDDRYHVIMTIHHLLLDGWSTSQLLGEILRQYGGGTLSSPRTCYRDFIEWLQHHERKAAEAYWRTWVRQFNAPTRLARSIVPPSAKLAKAAKVGYGEVVRQLAPIQIETLIDFSRQERVTVNTLVQAAWALLLGHYTGQYTVTFGVTVAGRPADLPGSDQMLGLFINTLPVNVELKPSLSVGEWLRGLQAQNLASREHEHTPLYEIQRWAGQQRQALFDSILVFENYPLDEAFKQHTPGGLVISDVKGREETNYPMTVSVVENNGFYLQYSYDDKCFSELAVHDIATQIEKLLREISQSATNRLGDLIFLDDVQQAKLKVWGVNEQRYASVKPVHSLIEKRAIACPEATALIFGDTELGYAELNRRANRLAHRLIALGIQPESRVGIAVERSIDMIVGLLAILKAGGAYVPLDPDYPRERLQHMVTDSGIELLLTQQAIEARIPRPAHGNVLLLDALDVNGYSDANPGIAVHGEHLAYIIYTSGSTGHPKGVAVAHHALVEHARIAVEFFKLNSADRMLQFSTINFDGFIEQLFPPLCMGAAIVLRGPALWDSETFYQELIAKRITVADLTTAYWFLLVQDFARQGARGYGALRQVHAGGEAMSPEGIKAWRQAGLSGVALLNTYGPTEAIVTATVAVCSGEAQGDQQEADVTIGRPLPARRIYLLDPNLMPVATGIAGELYIGGELLARGYLNRPGLTAERFIADPFDSQGGRLYRTGDLARWREDGQIEYLGRVDHQVKIRGFRIELGEIETQLLQQLAVREAVVVAKEGASGTRLVAYVALHADHAVTTHALRDALAQTLPDYMLPSAIVVLDSLPLNANGKVDRSRLPEPEFVSAGDYAAPEGEVEPVLANIWAEVLGMGRVGRNDNFFELGGDSILSLQIVTKARRAGWKITPRQLFERQTIAALAGVAKPVEEEGETVFAKQMAIDVAAPIPLLPIQLEFFEQPIPARHHWNQTVLLTSRQRLRAEWLDRALRAIVQHHRALRFCYEEQADGHWIQRATASAVQELLWERRAADHEQFLALCNAAQRSLDLHDGPLLRALLIDMADGTQRFLLAVHHLVIDGVSWRILLEDLKAAYDQSTRNEAIVLPEVTTDYAIWTQRLQHFPVTHAEEFDYWQSLAGITASLPCDFPEGSKKIAHQCSLTVKLDRLTTQALLKEAPVAYRTQVNDLLLTALGGALCRWSGHERILIDLEGHGREDLYADVDLSRMIGWFTSQFPIALSWAGEIAQTIKNTKEMLRQIPHKGLGYGLFKHYGTEVQRHILANLSKPQVVFNYLGQFDTCSEENSLWTLRNESLGESMDGEALAEHDISINCHIYDGEFCVAIGYSAARYAQATIETFANSYLAELKSVITHCSRSDTQGVTPSDFPLIRIAQEELDRLPIPVDQLADLYPLSPMQTGMLFHSVAETDEDIYLNQFRIDIDGLEVRRFKNAWQAAINRHEILRTGFIQEAGTPLQWIAKSAELPIIEYDWRDRQRAAAASMQQDLDALAQAEHALGLDFSKPPLMRLVLVRLADEKYHFIWTAHHLLLDGWSTSQLLSEILHEYGGEVLPTPQGRFRDFIEWLEGRDQTASQAYWLERLNQVNEPTRLASALPEVQHGAGYVVHTSELDQNLTDELVRFAKRAHVTVNTLMQAAWALLLKSYTGQPTVTFGVTVAGRPADLPGSEQMLGLFINTIPVCMTLRPEQPIADWLRDVQAQNLASREHEHTPLYEIQRWVKQSGQGLFDSILVFENYPIDETLQQSATLGLTFSSSQNWEMSNYPIAVAISHQRTLNLHFGYDCQYFSEETVNRLASQVKALLHAMSSSQTRQLCDITLLSEAEQVQLKTWGVNEQRYASVEPVHHLIEQQAIARPDATAL